MSSSFISITSKNVSRKLAQVVWLTSFTVILGDFPLRALMEGSGQREAGRGRREREAGEGGGRRRWEKGGGRLVPQLGTGRPGSWPSSVANLLCDLGQVISPALSLSLLPLKL